MKIKVEKITKAIIDTAKERKRINKCFKGETKEKLNQFMDAFESGDMKKAYTILCDKWWDGYDDKAGCCRREFFGLLGEHMVFEMMTYADLVCCIVKYKNMGFKIERILE